jgi:two-component system chemotaxis response regulator CheB
LNPKGLLSKADAIVLGGSAGAVEALLVLVRALPGGCPAAVLVVVHLPGDRPSLLLEIFAPVCRLPVREGEDKEPIERGTLYLAPAGYHMLVDEGPRIALSVDETVLCSRPSIDVLFESAADIYG